MEFIQNARRFKMIWKTYKYIYYWLYTWNKGLWGENDIPEFNAIIGMSLSLCCCYGSLAVIVDLISGISIMPEVSEVYIGAFALVFLYVHYLCLVRGGKYKKIENEFKSESKRERKRKGIWVLLYAFGSIALYIFLLFFGIWVKS